MVSIAGAAMVVPAAAPASWGQPSPPAGGSAVQPIGPFAGGDDPDAVVHSWALAPKLNDLKQGGSRADLSYEAPPGAELRDEVTLFNLSNVQLTFRVYATDAFNTDDGGFDLLPGDKPPVEVGTWVTLPQDSITLPAKTQATMPVTIKVPLTARPGDHAGAVLASSAAQGAEADGRAVSVDRRTGSRLYVRVAGPLAPRLTVEKLHATYRPGLNPFGGTADVTYQVVNRGNVRMVGRQRASASGPLGLLAKRNAASDVPELLPGQSYTVHTTFKGVAATALALARVRLEPALVGTTATGKATSWRSMAFAPPYSVLALVVSIWLVLRARRAYLRRTDGRMVEPSAR